MCALCWLVGWLVGYLEVRVDLADQLGIQNLHDIPLQRRVSHKVT